MFKDVNELINCIEKTHMQTKVDSLDYMVKLLDKFDHPEIGLPIIHIGGTNGKGSTVEYVKSILMEDGFSVATFTSPYVDKFNERIQVNGEYISDTDLIKYANIIEDKFKDKDLPSFFDFMTILAFLYFRDLYNSHIVDIVILEVGLGGIFDPTNVCIPLVSAITNVTFDHMQILGNTLKEIWTNKLGILKKDIPFITYSSEYDDLVRKANKISKDDSNLYFLVKSDILDLKIDENCTRFNLGHIKDIKLYKLGAYQAENAYLAISIIEVLNKYYGFNITEDTIRDGLAHANILGRLERISNNPVIILDGAHNVDAFSRLIEYIRTINHNKKVRLIVAISENKEPKKMVTMLNDLGDEIVFSEFNNPRRAKASELYAYSKHKNKKMIDQIPKMIEYVLSDNDHENYIFGSLFFVSEAREYLKGNN